MIALLVHLMAAWFVHPSRPSHARREHPLRIVLIVLKRTPRVKPTPRPTPAPVVHHPVPHIVVHHSARSAPRAHAVAPHAARARRAARPPARPHELAVATMRPALPTPLFESQAAGRGLAMTGANTAGANASAGTAGAGVGGGRGGNGTDTGNGDTPCGVPILENFGPVKTFDGLEHVSIRASVNFENGRTSNAEAFPYPFVYHGDEENPFSRMHRNDDFPTLVQLPPPGFDRSTLSPVIREIVENTGPSGFTRFAPCPQVSGAPDGPP